MQPLAAACRMNKKEYNMKIDMNAHAKMVLDYTEGLCRSWKQVAKLNEFRKDLDNAVNEILHGAERVQLRDYALTVDTRSDMMHIAIETEYKGRNVYRSVAVPADIECDMLCDELYAKMLTHKASMVSIAIR